jgi:hypothetical protein
VCEGEYVSVCVSEKSVCVRESVCVSEFVCVRESL